MGLNIRVKGEKTPAPSEMPPPGERRGTVIVDPGRATPPGLPVYVTRPALQGMLKRAQEAGDYEVGGFLLGGYHRWDQHAYVDITIQVPALKAESARAHLTFGNDVLREFHHTLDQRYPGKLVLGWYHTHPGYGLFLSSFDLFIQKGFYGQGHHVAVVIDPKAAPRDQVGVFVWEGSDVSDVYSLIVYASEAPGEKPKRPRA